MIIFVEQKHLEECFGEHQGVYLAVSCDLLNYADWMADGSGLVPAPDVVAHYISTGNKKTLRQEYYEYLTSPTVLMMLGLRIFQADKENVFFCYSKMEKESGYPKFLRQFIIENLSIPKDFVVKYKDFDGEHHRMKPKAYNKFMKFMKDQEDKCREAMNVME